ncbi:polysaccharide deacetylase family protein [Paenibacillus spiritus]|uniref:Polysaccharide deacetylase family protein n=1 Tax=Paenibacillus spiritus TaxID=2496557 RepID=A0A5J5FZB5_9BACL|nr:MULTISPECIES: polysaccharide deacetylase family protein [Paenibacillus]KAA8999700.1 polysaccharide deacetylase family protein [Paenibacillus spiritus]
MNALRLLGCAALIALLPSASGFAEASPKGREYYEQRGEIVWEVPTEDPLVALTFDDGPDRSHTPEILALLKQYNAKATFFVVGDKVARYPDLVRAELAAGHEVGNHTYHHPSLKAVSAGDMLKEIDSTQEAVLKATGLKPVLFRPPGGWYNEAVVELIKRNRMQLVLWSWNQDTWDWARPGVNHIVTKVLRGVKGGNIVLMHDYVPGSSQTVQALRIILPELQRRHYRFVTVSELLQHRPVHGLRQRAEGSDSPPQIPDPVRESRGALGKDPVSERGLEQE